ncbi:lipoate--protein ligase family protein [candidate division KSB1 bacterium]|nr:lipoate--protein ligase family protein [candidate division KSB1 bacterium]
MLWRFLETPPARGELNMAVDAAIARGGFCKMPTLRIFSWQPYCISLGYHQNAADVNLEACKGAGIDVARRPTGGGAIFHAHEVTYSVSVPSNHVWYNLLPLDLYRRVSEAIANSLQLLGAAVTFAPGEPRGVRHANGRPLRMACFATSARNEILCHGKKIVGSAQRRFREGTLQHGSILLGADHRRLIDLLAANEAERAGERMSLVDNTITLEAACGRKVEAPEVIKNMQKGFASTCEIQFEDSSLLPEENELAKLWCEKYRVFINN